MSPLLDRGDIARIRADHPIIGVLDRLGVYPPDRWNGTADFMVSCLVPGHRDSTPSCIIHPDTGRWHCFGCGAHGDVLDLVAQATGTRSLREIADRLDTPGPIQPVVGPSTATAASSTVSTGERPDAGRTPYVRVMAVNAEAWAYTSQPLLARRAHTYLAGRGIDLTALQAEAGAPLAGHTPYRADGLTTHLLGLGFTGDEIVDAGWATRDDETLTDRFRRRVIIPVRDQGGQVIGVYGRDVTGRAACKYLNTAHTVAFHKGTALYRPTSGPLGPDATVIVCEGSLDALTVAAHAAAAGLSRRYAPVSPSGTALTDAQARLVLAISPMPPVVCGDGDAPGQAASATWARTLVRHGREAFATLLPDGHDPASWLTEHGASGLAAFTRSDRASQPVGSVGRIPAAGLLADQVLAEHIIRARQRHHDTETVVVLPAVVREIAGLAVHLPTDAARASFIESAGEALANSADGGSPSQRTAQIRAAVARELAQRPAPERAAHDAGVMSLGR
ncbi:CHC2 zinc finger domain-containing protein [Jatrophihabitans cynanchi]|uniref:CHC2 zinc finger domain-containing protein n=1 Tax=Jatrophihabitans cynanchi TaxID=2944128 RepID=A0ABY7JV15_9ACTN|nr:CHC2 zinc finger domain-containing protein [Jatrophihabitans sp. SB3-54]WAX55142.1 CHC2 zinc finger domain-containing protein [Jatrophihabitans sp. SB3-54]